MGGGDPCPVCGEPPTNGECSQHGTPPPRTDRTGEVEGDPPPRAPRSQDLKMIGRRVGRYVIEGLIGRGGMGSVYRARHAELDGTVAIKFVDARVRETP